jgi:hypothetical protein
VRLTAAGVHALVLLLAWPRIAASQPAAPPPPGQDPPAAPAGQAGQPSQKPMPPTPVGPDPAIPDPILVTTPGDPGQDPLATPDEPAPPPKITSPVKRLDFGVSLFEAYDLATFDAGLPGLPTDARLSQDSSFSGVDASLSYSQQGHDKAFSALAGSNVRYYSISPEVLPLNYFGGLSFSSALGKRVSFHASESVSYSPFYSFGNFATPMLDTTVLTAPQTDHNIVRLDTISSSSSAGLSWMMSERSSVSFGGGFDDVSTSTSAYQIRTETATGTYAYRKTKYLSLRAGYGYHRSGAGIPNGIDFTSQDFNGGVSYRRPLSFSRRTMVGFDVGSSMLTAGLARSFYLTGNASLMHQISQTWAGSFGYSRSVTKIGGLATPFIADSLSAGAGGMITKHFGLNASAGYSHGAATLGLDNAYNSINGSARIHYDLTRYVPIYVEYVYYDYQFKESIGLAPGFPVHLRRSGLRTGLSYTLPLVGRRAGQR